MNKIIFLGGGLDRPLLVGRSEGEMDREAMDIESIDNLSGVTCTVDIPKSTYIINTSYFIGLFGPSIQKAGSREAFLRKYQFETHGRTYKDIERGIERVLFELKR